MNNKYPAKTFARTYAVLVEGVRLTKVRIHQVPHRGKSDQLLDHDVIRAPAIAGKIKQLV